tara:strand:- start:711 stop:1088 length:378 start_codon:yes stop_codon:yes gene_type:complete
MVRVFVFLVTLINLPVSADRYGIHEDYGGSSGGPFDILFGIICSFAAYLFLSGSYQSWKLRRLNNEKIERDNLLISLIGYAVVAFFLTVPIMLVIKMFGGAQAVKDLWVSIFALCYMIIAFLRLT